MKSKENNRTILDQQINLLFDKPKELEERSLIIIELLTNAAKVLNHHGLNIKLNQSNYEELKGRFSKQYRFYLIGLDGGIKHKINGLVMPDEIYRRIDSMPMRQNELNKHGKHKKRRE